MVCGLCRWCIILGPLAAAIKHTFAIDVPASCCSTAKLVKMMVAMWMSAVLFSVLVITNAAAQSCPANQIASDAQILLFSSDVLPTCEFLLPAGNFDANLTFFSDVLGYSDDEIQQEVQNVLHFFSERFGLEFSLTQPNELGLRFFQMPPYNQLGVILESGQS